MNVSLRITIEPFDPRGARVTLPDINLGDWALAAVPSVGDLIESGATVEGCGRLRVMERLLDKLPPSSAVIVCSTWRTVEVSA